MHVVETHEVGIIDKQRHQLTPTGKFILSTAMFVVLIIAVVVIDLFSSSSNALLPSDTIGKCQVTYISTDTLPLNDAQGSDKATKQSNIQRHVYAIVMPDGQRLEGYGVNGTYIPLDGEYDFSGVLRSDGGYNITIDSSYVPLKLEDIHEESQVDWDEDIPGVTQTISDFIWVPIEGFFDDYQETDDKTNSNANMNMNGEQLSITSQYPVGSSDMTLEEKIEISVPAPTNQMKFDGYAVDGMTNMHQGCAQPDSSIRVVVNYKNIFVDRQVNIIASLVDVATGEVLKNNDDVELVVARDYIVPANERQIDTSFDEEILDEFVSKMEQINAVAVEDNEIMPSMNDVTDIIQTAKQDGAACILENKEVFSSFYIYAHQTEMSIVDELASLQQIADVCERIKTTNLSAILSNGQFTMNIPVNGNIIEGKTVGVQVEIIYEDDTIIQLPLELNDPNYQITYPSLDTEATIRGVHEAKAEAGTVVVDTVKYTGLIPGVQYHIESTIQDKLSQSIVLDSNTGKKIYCITEFVPETSSGVFSIIFPQFDSTSLKGRTAVVTEKIYQCETNVNDMNASDGEIAAVMNENAEASNILHSAQKSTLVAAQLSFDEPLASIEFTREVSLAETGVSSPTIPLPQTGEDLRIFIFACIIIASLVAIAVVRARQRR